VKYHRETAKKNQSTATLVPMKKSLIHTRKKTITWVEKDKNASNRTRMRSNASMG